MKKLLLYTALSAVLTNTGQAQEIENKNSAPDEITFNLALNTSVAESLAAIKNFNPEADNAKTQQNGRREYKTKLANSAGNQVRIIMASSEVKIVGHNSDEVLIETNDYQAPPERAKGLKALYNAGEDNTGMGLSVTREGNVLQITKAQKNDGAYVIRVPKKVAVSYTETNWNGGEFELSDTDGEIELKLNNCEAKLNNVSGPLIANSTNGGIQVKFKNVNQQKPSSISVVSGEIDLTLPANTKANWNLRSVSGEVYTDFDMALPKEKSDLQKIAGSSTVEGKTNGGGVEMNIYSVSSDIFIRKSK